MAICEISRRANIIFRTWPTAKIQDGGPCTTTDILGQDARTRPDSSSKRPPYLYENRPESRDFERPYINTPGET